MPLTVEQEQLEHELRVEQMQTAIDTGRVNIEKMRDDMAKAEINLRRDYWRIVISVLVGAAACVGAGVALANYVNSKAPAPPPPAAPPQIIYIVPGQSPAPPAK